QRIAIREDQPGEMHLKINLRAHHAVARDFVEHALHVCSRRNHHLVADSYRSDGLEINRVARLGGFGRDVAVKSQQNFGAGGNAESCWCGWWCWLIRVGCRWWRVLIGRRLILLLLLLRRGCRRR